MMTKAYQHRENPRSDSCRLLAFLCVFLLCAVLAVKFYSTPVDSSNVTEYSSINSMHNHSSKYIKAVTWNIAAVNNNPFEYWITSDDPKYNELMISVSKFIENPLDHDITIKEVFTNDMFEELAALMTKMGWSGIEETRTLWQTSFQGRKIISEFIKDSLLGKKRLASMPDRVTNTINTVSGIAAMRPTVINCFDGELNNINQWWTQWKYFYFDKVISIKKKGQVVSSSVYQMISPIKKAKYPDITAEEEVISIPLQTLCMAIFDSILIHMMNIVGHDSWQPIRKDICLKLNLKKNDRTIEILEETYADADVIFLQEVAGNFPSVVKSHSLASNYDILQTITMDEDRDQNSFILTKKNKFEGFEEVTDKVLSLYEQSNNGKKLPVVNGDLVVMIVNQLGDNDRYLLASFHGDTNGLATKPVVDAVQKYAMIEHPDCKMLFGLDANTYATPEHDQQGVVDFGDFYTRLNLSSCYGPHPDPFNFTTFHARTHLQTQLNKAVSFEQKGVKGDKNPKDFIMFFNADFKVISTEKDNTGNKHYIDGMIFPTLTFPSDHAITSTLLLEVSPIRASGLRSTGSTKSRLV